MYAAATESLRVLTRRGDTLCVVSQNLYECWVVCTRPEGENGLGMILANAIAEQERMKSLFELLPDSEAIFGQWESLVRSLDVKGKPAHDARLFAAAKVHGLSA